MTNKQRRIRMRPRHPRAQKLFAAGKKLALLFLIAGSSLRAQGPPFQTDDPVPVELHHYEFYIFGSMDGTPAEMDSTGPVHLIAPWGSINPSNNPIYAPGGTGPSSFGFIDMELGAKIAFIKESKYIPQIGTFTMFEMPTGSYDKDSAWGKFGTRFRSGCKKISDTGFWMGAPERRSFPKPSTAISRTAHSC
jgi:hypothetical protein